MAAVASSLSPVLDAWLALLAHCKRIEMLEPKLRLWRLVGDLQKDLSMKVEGLEGMPVASFK